MKKALLILASMAMVLVSCHKEDNPGKEKDNDTAPAISKIELQLVCNVSQDLNDAFGIIFSGTGFDGKPFEFIQKKVDDSTPVVLCSKDNPTLTEDVKDNQFTIALNILPVPGFTATGTESFAFNYSLKVIAYDKKGNALDSGSFISSNTSANGEKGYETISRSLDRESFSETRGVWIAKTLSGIWQVGADKIN